MHPLGATFSQLNAQAIAPDMDKPTQLAQMQARGWLSSDENFPAQLPGKTLPPRCKNVRWPI